MPCDSNPKSQSDTKPNKSTSKDFTTADWLLFSTEKMAKRINPYIVSTKGNNLLVLSNVNCDDLKKIYLFTNTNSNNDYLYFDSISIKTNNSSLYLPGLNEIVKEIYTDEDNKANSEDQKFFKPFESIDELVDKFTSIVPIYPKLEGKEKYYTIKLRVKNL